MTISKANTVEEYLAALPPDRRESITIVRDIILKSLPAGYQEVMQYGMIAYVIPLADYPNTYNGQALAIASLASQKTYLALHLMGIYFQKETHDWFVKEYKASGKKLDMGKACVHFKKASDLPLELIAAVIAKIPPEQYIATYEKIKPPKKISN